MSFDVKLSTFNSHTTSGLTVVIPIERLQKYCPELAKGIDDKRLIIFKAKPCEGQDADKLARVALKFLHSERYQDTVNAYLARYYVGCVHIPALKASTEKKLADALKRSVTCLELKNILQAALVGNSKALARTCFVILMRDFNLEQLETLLAQEPYLEKADELIDLGCRLKRHEIKREEVINNVLKKYDEKIHELRLQRNTIISSAKKILLRNESQENFFSDLSTSSKEKRKVINSQCALLTNQIEMLMRMKNNYSETVDPIEQHSLAEWNRQLASLSYNKVSMMIPGVALIEDDRKSTLLVATVLSRDIELKSLLNELNNRLLQEHSNAGYNSLCPEKIEKPLAKGYRVALSNSEDTIERTFFISDETVSHLNPEFAKYLRSQPEGDIIDLAPFEETPRGLKITKAAMRFFETQKYEKEITKVTQQLLAAFYYEIACLKEKSKQSLLKGLDQNPPLKEVAKILEAALEIQDFELTTAAFTHLRSRVHELQDNSEGNLFFQLAIDLEDYEIKFTQRSGRLILNLTSEFECLEEVLRVLRVGGVDIYLNDVALTEFSSQLEVMFDIPDLVEINVFNGDMNFALLENLKLFIKASPSLAKITVSECNLTDEQLDDLMFVVAEQSLLQEVDLSKNHLTKKSIKNIVKFQNLTHLSLNQNEIGAEGAQTLNNHMPSGLIHLNLDDNDIGTQGIVDLLSRLSHHQTLRTLSLSDNAAGDQSISSVLDFLRTKSKVDQLNFCRNDIGTLGAKKLMDGLNKNGPAFYRTLDLRENKIKPELQEMLTQIRTCTIMVENLI